MDSAPLALVRRESLTIELSAILTTSPLATLHGPPGSGKSSFLASLVVYRDLTDGLRRCGKVLMISMADLAPDHPLRHAPGAVCASLDAPGLLRQLAARLGVDLPEPPDSPTFDQRWAWIENPDDRRAPGLLIIDGCDQVADAESWLWLAEQLIRPLVEGPTPICRVVCAQHRPIAWPLPELRELGRALPMEPFGEGEIAQYIASVLPIRSQVLASLLVLCTAGFPLGLVAWQSMLRPAPPAGALGEADDPRQWRTPAGVLLQPAPTLLAAGAALLRSFDKAALQRLFAPTTPAGRAIAERLGEPYAAAIGPRPFESKEYVRARQAMQAHRWLQPLDADSAAEAVTPRARDQIYALLQIDVSLSRAIDCELAAHYRARIEADPFRAQSELIDWLYYTAGRHTLCDNEWGRVGEVFGLLCERMRVVLRDNPFADVRVLSDLYTDRDVLLRLHERGIFAEVERHLQALVAVVSETLDALRGEGLQLHNGQEIRDDRLLPPRNPLLRLSQKALGVALKSAGASAQAWDLAVGPFFDAGEEFSRVWLQERNLDLYEALRRSGIIVGRGTNSLAPMLREMFTGEATLAARLSGRKPPETAP